MKLTGRNAIAPGGIALECERGHITSLQRIADPGPGAPWVGPGLWDLQVNGYGAGDANAAEPSAEEIVQMARGLAGHGVTRFMPTVITASAADMRERIAAIAQARNNSLVASMVAGIHVEGPNISPEDGPRGVHPLEHVRELTRAEVDAWIKASQGLLRIVTLSPHLESAPAITSYLVSRGVRVAIGHTHASEEQILRTVATGASLSTHLGNGAHGVLPRHPNYLWTQLAEPRLTAGMIADGHHLPDSVLATFLAAKREHGLFLVSDCVATPRQGRSGEAVSSVGGGVEVTSDGALRHSASGYLAGSIQTVDAGVATMARITGDLRTAMRLASVAPARALGTESPWRVGARADVLVFDWTSGDRQLRPRQVFVAGEEIA